MKLLEKNGYIIGLSTLNGKDITAEEENAIMSMIQNVPIRDGYGYRLKADLTWEEYELPAEDPPEATEQDFIQALQEVGIIDTD